MKDVVWTAHADEMLRERGVERSRVLSALAAPAISESDPRGGGRRPALRQIPEFGDRWLRVVYDGTDTEVTTVTVFFDRKAGP